MRFGSSPAYTINDGEYEAGRQWDLTRVNASTAWDYSDIRNTGLKLAIVDSGIYPHRDLTNKLVAGIDATPTKWWFGYNPQYKGDGKSDTNGHGTFVAGMAGAQTNNDQDVASSGWGALLMPIKVDEPDNGTPLGITFYSDNVRAGVDWAISAGAKVINYSGGGASGDSDLLSAVQATYNSGVFFVNSSGNDNRNSINYPGRYNYPNIITVGAIDKNDDKASYSNYGDTLDIVAPGSGLLGLDNAPSGLNQYGDSVGGTSFAAPMVSGALATLWYAGRALPYGEIRDIMFATADNLGDPGYDTTFGWGCLDFGKAAKFLLDSGIIYQFRNPSTGIRGYTKKPSELMYSQYDGMAFRIRTDSAPGLTTLYRMRGTYSNGRYDHLLTTNLADTNFGYTNVESVGFIATTQGADGMSVPLYRLSKPGNGHCYTTGAAIRDQMIFEGWIDEGTQGYCW